MRRDIGRFDGATHSRAAALDANTDLILAAGWRAAVCVASAIGAAAIGVEAFERWSGEEGLSDRARSSSHASDATSSAWTTTPAPGAPGASGASGASDASGASGASGAAARLMASGPDATEIATVAPATPRAPHTRGVHVVPNTLETEPPATEPHATEPRAQALAPADAPISTAPMTDTFARLSLDLSTPPATLRELGASSDLRLAGLEAPPPPPARASGIEARASAWVPDWRAPSQRDISLFVAADDEAVSWSLSDSSPNHGRLAYRDDRIEVGEMAAGISVSVRDMELALAYVSREEPSALGYSAREDYAGVVWTYRR